MQNKKDNSASGHYNPKCHATFNFYGNTQVYTFIQPGSYEVNGADGKRTMDFQPVSGKSTMLPNSGGNSVRAQAFTFPTTPKSNDVMKTPEKENGIGNTPSPMKANSAGGTMTMPKPCFSTPESNPICTLPPVTWSVQRW